MSKSPSLMNDRIIKKLSRDQLSETFTRNLNPKFNDKRLLQNSTYIQPLLRIISPKILSNEFPEGTKSICHNTRLLIL
jgi:hypothetical protein